MGHHRCQALVVDVGSEVAGNADGAGSAPRSVVHHLLMPRQTLTASTTHARFHPTKRSTVDGLVEDVEYLRLDATRNLDPTSRSELGQFLTPPPVARLMASLFEHRPHTIRLLDAGCGVGSLTAAFVERVCQWETRPHEVAVTGYELDPTFARYLDDTARRCTEACTEARINFDAQILAKDFIESGVSELDGGLFKTVR